MATIACGSKIFRPLSLQTPPPPTSEIRTSLFRELKTTNAAWHTKKMRAKPTPCTRRCAAAGAKEAAALPWMPLTAPLMALRVMATHRERVERRLLHAPHCCELVYAEQPRTGRACCMLFRPTSGPAGAVAATGAHAGVGAGAGTGTGAGGG